jgi:glycerophosphoryl diester phosphodiesterase
MTSGARRAAAQVLAGLLATTALVGSSPAVATAVSGAAHRASVASWSGGPLVIAHRGASGVAPENTLPAMRAAVRAGADLVEFDVQRTRDGRLMVVHDPTFVRTTDVATVFPGRQDDPVGSFTWAEVKQLDAGSWFGPRYAGTRVPSLSALLRVLAPSGMRLLLELKAPGLYPDYERQVAHELERHGFVAGQRVWVHSFDAAALEAFHDLTPSVPVGLISETGTVPAKDAAWLTTVNAVSSTATDGRVDMAARAGLHVLTWPSGGELDGPARLDQLVDDGVDGIITDRPALTRGYLETQA